LNPDCRHVHDRLAGYLERDLAPPERAEVEAHLASCGPCRAAARVTGAMVAAMGSAVEPPLPEGFSDGLRARLAALDTPRPARPASPARWGSRRWPVPGLIGVAAALGLALAFVLTAPWQRSGTAPAPGPSDAPVPMTAAVGEPVHVDLGGDAVAHIWFDAAEPIDGVRFTLEIPAGVRVMEGGEAVAVSTLSWEGSLAAGRNVIKLPLRGVARGTWTVTAKVEKDGDERAQTVGLVVNGA